MPAHSPAELHRLFERAFNDGDVETLSALYEPDAVLVVGGREVIGRENIQKAFETLLERGGQMTLQTDAAVVSPSGLAVLHGRWTVDPAPGTGLDVATRGISTEVARRQADGTWLFVIDNPYTPALSLV